MKQHTVVTCEFQKMCVLMVRDSFFILSHERTGALIFTADTPTVLAAHLYKMYISSSMPELSKW